MNDNFKSNTHFRDKLEKEHEPKVVEIPPNWQKSMGIGSMIITSPLLVDELVRKIPKGKVSTIKLMREKFADDFKTVTACPLTTGIFLRIVADAAEEDRLSGKKNISPYWRVIKDDGSLNPKFPGGIKNQYKHLLEEGFEFTTSESKHVIKVKDYAKKLFDFS